MASVQTEKFEGRYLKLTCEEIGYSVADNTSTVRWTLQSIGGAVDYYTIYNWGVWVNGETIYSKRTTYWSSYDFPAEKGTKTGTITVRHNTDGSVGTMGFTLMGSVYNNKTKTYNGELSLTQLNRNMNVYQSLSSKTPNSITMNWSSSETANYIWYSLDGGNSWTGVGSVNARSGSYTITGLSPNTSYNIRTRAQRKDTSLNNNYSSTLQIYTYKSYSVVSSVSYGDIQPFSCTAYCYSSNPSNTDRYEYSLCDSNRSVIDTYTSTATYYNITGLSEETTYYIRCRVRSSDSGYWSDYVYSSAFTTTPDQVRAYIKESDSWAQGKVYIKVAGSWVKAKKAYIKQNGEWVISRNS